MALESTSVLTLESEGINRLDDIEESPEPGYGLLAFARDLHAERCRLDQQALEAARQTLAQEGV